MAQNETDLIIRLTFAILFSMSLAACGKTDGSADSGANGSLGTAPSIFSKWDAQLGDLSVLENIYGLGDLTGFSQYATNFSALKIGENTVNSFQNPAFHACEIRSAVATIKFDGDAHRGLVTFRLNVLQGSFDCPSGGKITNDYRYYSFATDGSGGVSWCGYSTQELQNQRVNPTFCIEATVIPAI